MKRLFSTFRSGRKSGPPKDEQQPASSPPKPNSILPPRKEALLVDVCQNTCEDQLVSQAIEAEAASYVLPVFAASFYSISGCESDGFQMLVSLIQNCSGNETNEEQQLEQLAEEVIQAQNEIVTEQTSNGNTLLHIAILHGKNKLIKPLLENGAKLSQKDHLGRQAVHFAAATNNCEAIAELKRLCQEHMAVHWANSPDMQGYTPLHYAAENVAFKAVRGLLEIGANLALQDDHGLTPLHVAVKQVEDQSPDAGPRLCLNKIIEMMINASTARGMEPPVWQLVELEGLTPSKMARRHGFQRTADFLEQLTTGTTNFVTPSAPVMTASLMVQLNGSQKRSLNDCCICFSNEVDCLLEPCSHLAICSSCTSQVTVCPICRSPIASSRKVYFS